MLLQSIEPAWLLLLTACVLLLQEAREAVHFSNPTPNLDFLLGRKKERQAELEVQEPTQDDIASQDDTSSGGPFMYPFPFAHLIPTGKAVWMR